jgi:hypothetical protein
MHKTYKLVIATEQGQTVRRGYFPDNPRGEWYACVDNNTLLGTYHETEVEREQAIAERLAQRESVA